MIVAFISGPFRAPTAWDVEQNIRRAEEFALRVWRRGAAALCPHTNTRFFQGSAPDDVWLEGDLEMLRRCDCVLVLSESEDSSGTAGEVALALHLGIEVIQSADLLTDDELGECLSWITRRGGER